MTVNSDMTYLFYTYVSTVILKYTKGSYKNHKLNLNILWYISSQLHIDIHSIL